MNQEERYKDVIAKRFNAQGEGVQDFSGPVAPGVGREALEAAQLKSASQTPEKAPEQVAQEASSSGGSSAAPMAVQPQGSAMATIGQAGMMSGNPYLMAGGLGLQVLAQGEANKRAEQEAQRQAYNQRIKDRQEAMARIASMGIQ